MANTNSKFRPNARRRAGKGNTTANLSPAAKATRRAAGAAATAALKAGKATASKTRGRAKANAQPAKVTRVNSPRAAKVTRTNNRPMTFTLPPAGKVKPPRAGSKRARVLAALQAKGGATHTEIMKLIGWDRVTAYEGIRLLSIHNGYGLRADEKTGKIVAYIGATPRKGRAKAGAA